MLGKLKLSHKLISAFFIVALISGIIGLVGYLALVRMKASLMAISNGHLPSMQTLLSIKGQIGQGRVCERTLLNQNLTKAEREKLLDMMSGFFSESDSLIAAYGKLPKTGQEAELWRRFTAVYSDWRDSGQDFNSYLKQLDKLDIVDPDNLREKLERVKGDLYRMLYKVGLMIEDKTVFDGEDDPAKCSFGKWAGEFRTQNSRISEIIKAVAMPHRELHESVQTIKKLVAQGNSAGASDVFLGDTASLSSKVAAGLDSIMEEANKAQSVYRKMQNKSLVEAREREQVVTGILDKIIDIKGLAAKDAQKSANKDAAGSTILIIITICLGVCFSILSGLLLSIGITKSLSRIVSRLSQGAVQTASSAAEVSGASQQLSLGATEQAASLEETSSSLEQISSMTKENADSAFKANELAQNAMLSADQGNHSMILMQDSMGKISEASSKISKIIKTIEEIAFQTNLLALNAAVEAARAGENGKGFAVVAEEVRNLARRSAESAKDTTALINDSINKVKGGAEIALQAGESLKSITASAKKVADIVSQISKASNEQSQGIVQVSETVSQMDKVTQQNAASAERTASAAQILSSQAVILREMVSELENVVGGRENRGNTGRIAQDKNAKGRCLPVKQETKGQRGKLELIKPEEVTLPYDDKA